MSEHRNLVRTGYACAFLFPIAGIVLGIIIACKPGRVARHGAAILVLCTLVIAAFTAYWVHQYNEAQAQAQTSCIYTQMFGWNCG